MWQVFAYYVYQFTLSGRRAWKVAPALAAGCTIVMKPSELCPLTALVCFPRVHRAIGLMITLQEII